MVAPLDPPTLEGWAAPNWPIRAHGGVMERIAQITAGVVAFDMTFVQDVGRSDHDRAIVEGILRLADSLHLDVVAEGIELTSQRDLLRNLDCRFGQGYLFGRPSPNPETVAVFQGELSLSPRDER